MPAGSGSYKITHDWLAIKSAVISGGVVGNHTVTGIRLGSQGRSSSNKGDQLLAVLALHDNKSRDGVIGGSHTIGVGTTDDKKIRMSDTVHYMIGGIEYVAKNIEITVTTGEVTQSKWGAWRILIDKLGAGSMQRATANGTSGTMAFDNEEDALLSLAQIAITANTVEIGYLTIDAATNGFTPGTDVPNSSSSLVDNHAYYNVNVPRLDNGFTATPSVSFSAGTNNDEYAFGTINVRTNALNVAQISADTTQPWADADIITTSGKYGGHLIVSNLAGTNVISLSQTGIAGSAQTVDSNTSAIVQTALDAAIAALPNVFTVLGQEITLANKSTFTYNTDDLAGTDGTTTFVDAIIQSLNGSLMSDLTSEFSITANNVINNASGTPTSNVKLLVLYVDDNA